MGPVLQAILQSSFLVKILGTRETAGLKDPLNRPARNERDEEFHRLPEHGIDRSLGPEAQHTYDSSVRLEDMHWEGRARKNGKEITSIESGENDV